MGTRERLLAGIVAEPHDIPLRLVYADWLEENGDAAQAQFIRARCAFDHHVPDPDEYPTLIERYLEALHGAREPEFRLPEGMKWGCWWDSNPEEWWSDASDCMEGGLLSFAAVKEEDPPVERLAELVRTTPVRGLDLTRVRVEHLPALLAAPAARHLRRVEGSAQEVAASPVAASLTRLAINPPSEADAAALAAAHFDRLERLAFHGSNCSAAGLARLVAAPWFRRLRRLLIGFNDGCAREGGRRLGGMPDLHTLVLWDPEDGVLLGLGDAEPLPELRRLLIHCADLRGDRAAALGRLQAPRLVELWLRNSKLGKADLRALAATPLFHDLRVLTFDSVDLTHTALDAVAASPCAKRLRILRINHGKFLSLARSALGRPGAFPALTTLRLHYPFARTAPAGDTAAFLAALAAPNLRHLDLASCELDDASADALATNATFVNLTRLVINGSYDARGEPVSARPEKLRELLRSRNLCNLTVLQLWNCGDGTGAEVLADKAILPRLASATLYGVSKKVAMALADRPAIRCTT